MCIGMCVSMHIGHVYRHVYRHAYRRECDGIGVLVGLVRNSGRTVQVVLVLTQC